MNQPAFAVFYDNHLVFVPQGQQAPEMNPQRGPGGAPPAETGTQQDGAPEGQRQGGQEACFQPQTMLMLVLLFGVMYFMLIRPANKQRKEQATMQSALGKGDKIVTSGGIHGTVSTIGDKTVTVRIDNIQMTIERSAIARVMRDDPETGDKAG